MIRVTNINDSKSKIKCFLKYLQTLFISKTNLNGLVGCIIICKDEIICKKNEVCEWKITNYSSSSCLYFTVSSS